MRVREDDFQLRLPKDPNRSKGLHLSTILRNLAFASKILDAKYDVPMQDKGSETAQLGLAFEDYLAKYQHPEIKFHPGEFKLDGISMSPDGIQCVDSEDLAEKLSVEMYTYILDEFKFTRKSSRDFKESLVYKAKNTILWLWQIMAYRYAMNHCTEYKCNVARLRVMFVNGNYSRDFSDPAGQPTYKVFVLYFTDEELENNWKMIVSHRDYMEREGLLTEEGEG